LKVVINYTFTHDFKTIDIACAGFWMMLILVIIIARSVKYRIKKKETKLNKNEK